MDHTRSDLIGCIPPREERSRPQAAQVELLRDPARAAARPRPARFRGCLLDLGALFERQELALAEIAGR